ncbi:MAG: hypothetical protein IKX36_06950 [Prevotella sp.]|nr:hypothetical protein [Prevotella sp.]
MEKKSLEDLRIDFLLSLREAVNNNQMTVIMFFDPDSGECTSLINNYGVDFENVKGGFNQLTFIGRISTDEAFEGWNYYYEDVALAEIYGFELANGTVQMSILDGYVMPGTGDEDENEEEEDEGEEPLS